MRFTNVIDHAKAFADHLEANISTVHAILRKYQSKGVIDYEIRQSIENLRSLAEINRYFPNTPFSQETATFLPLNLPLYSFVLFAAIPSYQSMSLILRPPQRMQALFNELFNSLSFGEHYPNVRVFTGSRESFLLEHCKKASVVIFTGKYENFLRISKACSKDTIVLFNGVGHNPIVITPSANIKLAVEKTMQVKLLNNGQDCAGPDVILVHSSVADAYLQKLIERLSQVRCDTSYQNDDTVVGPLFESSSLLGVANLISNIRHKGAKIVYGGQIDLNHNVMYPCVVRTSLRQLQNFTELYSPLFLVTEYDHDQELALYFNDPGTRYQNNEMYISLFGESDYVTAVRGSIILKNRTIHDVERGTEEYGGYSPGASSVSYQGIHIQKPLLIPREISNFLSPQGQRMFAVVPKTKGNWEQEVVTTQFQEIARNIFGDQLIFAYIFGSFAIERDRRYSDVDTLICVHNKQLDHVKQYLSWLFSIHEMFGRIPDFKYPAEIVSFADLQNATARLPTINLSVAKNETANYDAMVWCHCLSQPWIGTINPENVPEHWKGVFPNHSSRLLRSFLKDLEQTISTGADISQLHPEVHNIPRKEPELSHYIENLSNRGLLSVLKMIPFEENPMYTEIVLKLVAQREFIGKSFFAMDNAEHLYDPYFRFGVVTSSEP